MLMIYMSLVVIYLAVLVLVDPAGGFWGFIVNAVSFLMNNIFSYPLKIANPDYPFFWEVNSISTATVLIFSFGNALIQSLIVVYLTKLFKRKEKAALKPE